MEKLKSPGQSDQLRYPPAHSTASGRLFSASVVMMRRDASAYLLQENAAEVLSQQVLRGKYRRYPCIAWINGPIPKTLIARFKL